MTWTFSIRTAFMMLILADVGAVLFLHADFRPFLDAFRTCRGLDQRHRWLGRLQLIGGPFGQQHFMAATSDDTPHALARGCGLQAPRTGLVRGLLGVGEL